MEIYSIIENLEEDYDDNELIEALADVLMDRQEKVNTKQDTFNTMKLSSDFFSFRETWPPWCEAETW